MQTKIAFLKQAPTKTLQLAPYLMVEDQEPKTASVTTVNIALQALVRHSYKKMKEWLFQLERRKVKLSICS
jgi:hypothetical protein